MSLIAIIFLVVLVMACIPAYPYSRGWGPYPAGGLFTILLIVILLAVLGVI